MTLGLTEREMESAIRTRLGPDPTSLNLARAIAEAIAQNNEAIRRQLQIAGVTI